MIILEGCDNTGKTTLGNFLSERLGWELIHSTRFLEDQKLRSRDQLSPAPIIMDRVYSISDSIYGRSLGREIYSRMDEVILDLIHRPYLIIYCRPDLALITEDNGRDHMEGVKENVEAIVREYDKFIRALSKVFSGSIVCYDYADPDSLGKVTSACYSYVSKYYTILNSVRCLVEGKNV